MNTAANISLDEKLLADFELAKELDLTLGSMRSKAFEKFRAIGIPSKKNEEYKYAPFDRIINDAYVQQLFPEKIIAPETLENILINHTYADSIKLVFINGIINADLSDIELIEKGLNIKTFQEYSANHKIVTQSALQETKDPFALLNGSFANHRMVIELIENVALTKSIHLIFISNSSEQVLMHNKIAIVIGNHSKANFIETHLSVNSAESISNHFVEFFIGSEAKVNHVLVQDNGDKLIEINNTFANLDKHSVFNTHTFSFSGKIIRNNLNILLNAPECEASLYGFYHPSAEELMDNHTLVDHRMPHCLSNELYKGVIEDHGTAVFNGKVYVRPDAQKTNAYQSNKNILLGAASVVNTKPQLEIYADDVKCSHGSSTGFIDDESLFYLQSRGIGKERAKALLLYAYAAELLNNIEIESAKILIEQKLAALFGYE
ncbi:MAG: Fe-S cluster assembly protein SufD [Flavobacteriales bacterium]